MIGLQVAFMWTILITHCELGLTTPPDRAISSSVSPEDTWRTLTAVPERSLIRTCASHVMCGSWESGPHSLGGYRERCLTVRIRKVRSEPRTARLVYAATPVSSSMRFLPCQLQGRTLTMLIAHRRWRSDFPLLRAYCGAHNSRRPTAQGWACYSGV